MGSFIHVPMALGLLACYLLCSPLGQALAKCVAVNHTLYVEREGCDRCVAVNTTMCIGFCFSREPNLNSFWLKSSRVQRVCTYQSLAFRAVTLPGCLPNVDPLFFFPVAQRCRCGHCNPSYTECLHKDKRLPDQCNPLPRIDPAEGSCSNSTARNITEESQNG